METWAFGFSAVSLLLSGVSTYVAVAARRDTRAAGVALAWAAAIEAVGRMPRDLTVPVGDRLVDVTVRLTTLVDTLHWDGLGEWLVHEQRFGSGLGRQTMERLSAARTGLTIDEHLDLMKPYLDWQMAFTSNLRHLRNVGHDRAALQKLTDQARRNAESIFERHGWPMPENPLTPLT